MASQKDKRQRVSDLLHAQIDTQSISIIVGVSLRTIYNNHKTIDMDNSIQRKPDSGGIKNKRNRNFIDVLKTKIGKDPTISIRKITVVLKVGPKTVRKP